MSMKQSKDSAGQEISGAWLYTTVVTILRKRIKSSKKTELSTQILAVNNHIYPACEIDTVINLDLDQFNKLSIVLQVNIKLQTKPSSLLDCIATEHEVLKEIIAYYSDKKISDRSRAALTLKTKAQTELPRYFFYGH